MIEILNNIADKWFAWQIAMLWQVTVLIAIVWVIDLVLRKWAWPQVRYALWLLVLVKLILPPTLVSPASITAKIPFFAQKAVKVQINQLETKEDAIKENRDNGTTEAFNEVIGYEQANAETKTIKMAAVSLSWKAYALFVWLAGIAILSIWLAIKLANLRREQIKKGEHVNLPERFKELVEETAAKIKLRKVPQIILTNKVNCPAVFGAVKPVLLMPADKLQNLTREDIQHILLHELAHIKRGDLTVHAIYMALQIAYWFNPLVWLIRRQLQNLRELCCDATVARILKEKTGGYRETLLETARQLLAESSEAGLGLLGLYENSNRLVDRLKWLEKKTWKNRPVRIFTISILVCLMAFCVLPMAKGKDSVQRTADSVQEEKNSVKRTADSGQEKTNSGKFSATLPNGATVELMGVCEHPSQGKQWWKPDGLLLNESPYEYLTSRSNPTEDEKSYEIVFRFDDFNDDISLKIKALPFRGSNGFMIPEKGIKPIKELRVFTLEQSKDVEKCNVSLGVAAGAWQTLQVSDGTASGTSHSKRGNISFSEAFENTRGEIVVTVADDMIDEESRIVAINREGNVIKSKDLSILQSGQLRQTVVKFEDCKLREIRQFQFQTRPYEWVEFKNVSLKPGIKTDVHVEVKEEFTTKNTKEVQVKHDNQNDKLIFESYFPDDIEAGKKLDEWWKNKDKISIEDEAFFELFRKGIRRCTVKYKDNFLMQYIGGKYVWHKQPNEQKAIDIIYNASYGPGEYKYYAVYSGLSVANPKSQKVLQRLAELAVEQSHQIERIVWGVYISNQQQEFLDELKPYFEQEKSENYKIADYVAKAVRGEIRIDELQATYRNNWNKKQTTDPNFSSTGQDEIKDSKEGAKESVQRTVQTKENGINSSGQDAMEGEVFRIAVIKFEPIKQGKNIVWITVENKSDKEQFFGVNVYSRSVDYGPQGIGWGTTFYEQFDPGQTKKLRYVYKIQGPVTKNTYTRLCFYNAKSLEHNDNKDLQPFTKKQYTSDELEKFQPAASDFEQVSKLAPKTFYDLLEKIQTQIKNRDYESVWALFSDDYKKGEYQNRGPDAFKRQMEPKHKLDSAFTWEKEDFLSLKATGIQNLGDKYILYAVTKEEQTWTIDWIWENDEWKIDWIAGYTPGVVQNWEVRVLPKRQKYSSKHFDIYYEKGSSVEKDIEKISDNRDNAFEKIREFLGTEFDKRIKLVFYDDANTKLLETGHQGEGWSYDLTIVEVYNKTTQLDPFTSTSYIVKEYLGDPPALFNYGFSLYMVEQLGQKALKNLSGGDLSLYERAKQLKEQGKWIGLAELITYTDIGPAESRPDISYAETGAFVKFLIDNFGRDKFLQAYRQLKNSDDKTVQQENIKKFEQIYGASFGEIDALWQATLDSK